MIDTEREAHRDEVIKTARKVLENNAPSIFGVPNPHVKALADEIKALDQYDARHKE